MAHSLEKFSYPARWPYTEQDFFRLDRSDDAEFYAEPRFVKHLDENTLKALTDFYSVVFPDRPFTALDICSSWISHYPQQPKPTRLAITGMNAEELKSNVSASDWTVQDLNLDPRLPYKDAEHLGRARGLLPSWNRCPEQSMKIFTGLLGFDVVTNVVSVDYLTKPLQVFQEVGRVLRPGGLAIVAFSNRCFLSKLVSIWSVGDPDDRAEVAANYFHFAGGFKDAEAVELLLQIFSSCAG
ncbi:Neuroglobin-2 [Durusdinium trenchii]|uniref:Neuroglobin-2 n=1 Tax=Durusdinium trenchii TaxID=1381693 RepID=A0ABP0QBA9_9DINO